jgi:hypothetical protein
MGLGLNVGFRKKRLSDIKVDYRLSKLVTRVGGGW